jgi:hypothetical protein
MRTPSIDFLGLGNYGSSLHRMHCQQRRSGY